MKINNFACHIISNMPIYKFSQETTSHILNREKVNLKISDIREPQTLNREKVNFKISENDRLLVSFLPS